MKNSRKKKFRNYLLKRKPSPYLKDIFRLFIAPMAKAAFSDTFARNPVSMGEIYEWFFNTQSRHIKDAKVKESFSMPGKLLINSKKGYDTRIKAFSRVIRKDEKLIIIYDMIKKTYQVEICVKYQPNYIMSETVFRKYVKDYIEWINS